MSNINFSIPPLRLTRSAVFEDASAAELRVLLALIELGGKAESAEELAELAKTSKARCTAALALWEESGVIVKALHPCEKTRTVAEEFEDSFNEDDIEEDASVNVAAEIRDENLADALAECARLMDKAALSTQEIKTVCVLSTQYALSPEYIITLAAHLASKGKITAVRLRDEAKRLVKRDIDTVEALEQYINDRERESAAEWEFRKVLGIYNRSLTPTEKKYFNKWANELGYSTAVVTYAFDICVSNTGKVSCSYIDKLLTCWHDMGCTTVAECESANESYKNSKAAGETTKDTGRRRAKSEAPKPRYGDFDINEAFQHALSRSFSDDE